MGHVLRQNLDLRGAAELHKLGQIVRDQEAIIAVTLQVERGGTGLSLSGGLGLLGLLGLIGLRGVVQDDAVGEVQVDQVWLLVAGDFA